MYSLIALQVALVLTVRFLYCGAGYQALRGDTKGARQTQSEFTRAFPLISPVRSHPSKQRFLSRACALESINTMFMFMTF